MPFNLPPKLLEWLKKRSPEAKIDQLVRTIGQLDELIRDREDALSALVRKHIFMAEEDCNAAMVNSKFDSKANNAECLRRIEFGLFRLELAKQQLTNENLDNCRPNFVQDTPEYRALEISGAITKMKMAIEFSNCVVSEDHNLQLVRVVKLFNESIELLKSNKQEQSKRTAEVALLLLYQVKREIELDNYESIVDLDYLWENTSRRPLSIKKGFEDLYNLKATCYGTPSQASIKVINRIEAALEKMNASVEAYAKADDAVVGELVTASVFQIKLASESFQHADIKEENCLANSKQENESGDKIREFKTTVLVLQKLVTGRAEQAVLANRRLDASLKYYEAAASKLGKILAANDNRKEEHNHKQQAHLVDQAKTLIRSAHLDLEFARNLLLTPKEAPYHEIIKRIAKESESE
ncbi:hypothetical protein BH11CYA1_BH11CYA1_41500 [soil metagenome]